MNTKLKIRYRLFFNLLILLFTIIIVLIFRIFISKYFSFGSYEDLVLVCVQIDTWTKWTIAVFVIGLINDGDLLVNDIGNPILGFNVYNPNKIIIDEFTTRMLLNEKEFMPQKFTYDSIN